MPRPAAHVLAVALALASLGAGASGTGTATAGGLLPGQIQLGVEPPELVARLLESGMLVLDRPGDFVRAYVVFDRPLDRVYELLSATSRQPEYRSEIDSVATVARTPEGPIDEHHLRIMFLQVSYRLRYRLDPVRSRIAWELDPDSPGPMRRVEGSWELYEMAAGRTLGRFATAVDVGDALPAFLQEAVTRRTLARTLERCRRWVNADGAMR